MAETPPKLRARIVAAIAWEREAPEGIDGLYRIPLNVSRKIVWRHFPFELIHKL